MPDTEEAMTDIDARALEEISDADLQREVQRRFYSRQWHALPAGEAEPKLLRPIIGIENRTAQEVFDIMSDRIRRSALIPAPQSPAPASAVTVSDARRIWFDTEFIEDGKTIELVSIGMVREDGKTYYAEVQGVDYSRADPWLHENVFPHLQGGSCLKSRDQIAAEILEFAGEKPEFWAYYADYDWVALCQLYGRMIDLPKGWPMFCRDLKQLAGDSKLPKQTGTEHHALADAMWAKEAHAALANRDDTTRDG